jgi:hypothetical protein
LEEVAKVIESACGGIKNFDENAVFNFINNFNDNSINHGPLNSYNCTFNPLDKVVQLYDEKIALYERMLKDKEAMIDELKKLLNKEN